jgi:SET domain-containing protein
MTKEKIIYSIRNNCNVYLKPSTVCNGVGLFALIDIPMGTVLFEDIQPDSQFISWDEIGYIPEEVKRHLGNLCISVENGIFLNRTASAINLSYYINHSEKCNVVHLIDIDRYVTVKDISKGEEILCVYNKEEIDW